MTQLDELFFSKSSDDLFFLFHLFFFFIYFSFFSFIFFIHCCKNKFMIEMTPQIKFVNFKGKCGGTISMISTDRQIEQ